jgi:CheY-like chemotaxis protein
MSIKVLIVEDNDDYRDLISYYLKSSGFEVIIAVNGLEAVTCAESDNPHIILMDLNLPVMDGWEATRIIHQNQATAHIPILAVSANCSNDVGGQDVLQAGAIGCVQKPVDITLLPDLIVSYAANH